MEIPLFLLQVNWGLFGTRLGVIYLIFMSNPNFTIWVETVIDLLYNSITHNPHAANFKTLDSIQGIVRFKHLSVPLQKMSNRSRRNGMDFLVAGSKQGARSRQHYAALGYMARRHPFTQRHCLAFI